MADKQREDTTMLRLFYFGSLLAVSSLIASAATAAPTESIGLATVVVNQVRAEFDKDDRDLTKGDNVHQDELIKVGQDSIGEIILEDDTKLALGPGSELLLDKFVYDGKKTNGEIVVDLVQGTFRFITGIASKKSYRIKTRAASITVRGTIFDVYVAPNDMMWVLLMEGGVTACNDNQDCRDLDKPGMLIRVEPDGKIVGPVKWAMLPGKEVSCEKAFPFMVAAPKFEPTPPFNCEMIRLGKLIDPPLPEGRPKPPKTKKKYKPKKKKKAKKYTKPKKKVTKKKTKRKRKRTAKKPSGADIGKAIAIGVTIGKIINSGGGGRKPPGNGGGGGGHNPRY